MRDAFLHAGYHASTVSELLGSAAEAALGRGELLPADRQTRGGSPLETLVRLFVLGLEVPLPALDPAGLAVDGRLIAAAGNRARALVDIRPYGDRWWVVSDLAPPVRPGPPATDHVLGVGGASLALAGATLRRPVTRALDLGTGCGVQALHLQEHANQVDGTDVNARALQLASLTLALSGVTGIELLKGSLLEPVAGRRYDLVVSNPPFVMAPEPQLLYRDSPMPLDGLTMALLRDLPGHLTDGGVAQLLASWVHRPGQDWRDRVGGWLTGVGCDALVLQREVLDPAAYVAMWAADAADPGGYERWLEAFEQAGVDGVGFGVVTLRRTGRPAVVELLDAPQSVSQPIGPALGGWLDRAAALQQLSSLDAAVLEPADKVRLVAESAPGREGFTVLQRTLRQQDGLRWEIVADEVLTALVAGCDGHRPLSELLPVLQAAFGVDPAQVRAVAGRLVQRGFLLLAGVPAEREPGTPVE